MNEKEQKSIVERLDKELKIFKREMLKTSKENIFYEYSTIRAYFSIANCIKENLADYEYCGFPKYEGIIANFYQKLIDTDCDYSLADLKYNIDSVIESNARRHKQNEGEM